jgi:hypothetical protein
MRDVEELYSLNDSLDPEALQNACSAYEKAITALGVHGLAVTCDVVAERIVTIVRAGIIDPDRLCRLALTGLMVRKP